MFNYESQDHERDHFANVDTKTTKTKLIVQTSKDENISLHE